MNELEIKPKIVFSSELKISKKGSDRVLDICKTVGADSYITGTVWAQSHLRIEEFKKSQTQARMNKRGGGMTDIYEMTQPLGYANGGQPITIEQIIRDAKASRGPAEVTHPIQKIISDRTIVDPYSVSQKERLKELGSKARTGIETLKGLGSGVMGIGQELLGAGPAEATVSGMHPLIEFQEMYDQYIIDGGDMPFKEFFDMIQIELDKMAGE